MHCRRTRPWFSSTWAILARDGYLPHQFGHRGLRFAYSNGIVILGTLAILLVIIFGGRTHALIPLFAIGVFLCFTLSQTGMVRHWQRLHGSGWPAKLAINALGAVTAGSVTLIVVSTEFVEGAWIVLVLVPVLVASFASINAHTSTSSSMSSSIVWPDPPGTPASVLSLRALRGSIRYDRHGARL